MPTTEHAAPIHNNVAHGQADISSNFRILYRAFATLRALVIR